MREFLLNRVPQPAMHLLVVVLAFPALFPLLAPGYLEGHDSLVHLFRVVELHRAFAEGDFYPRWFPDLALGYGYPLLNYHPPLTYYIAEAFHLLGFGFIESVKLTIAAGTVLSGWGMYLYANRVSRSRSAALLAAIAYTYLPYRLIDVYVRGSLAEATSLAFMPFLLLFFHFLAATPSTTYLIASALLLAAFFLVHPIVLFFVPVLGGYALIVSLLSNARRQSLSFVAAAFLFGLAASAFYWLPALMEQRYASPDNFAALGITPSHQLMKLADLVQRKLVFDYGEFPFKMGMAGAILAVVGLMVMIVEIAWHPRRLLPFSIFPASAIFFLFLMSPFSATIWDITPFIDSIEFPWRLLAFVGLGSSICISFIGTIRRIGPYLAIAAAGLLILTSTLSLAANNLEIREDSLSIGMIARHEYNSGVIGTTYAAEFLPSVARAGFISPVHGAQKPPTPDNLPILDKATIERTGPLAYPLAVSAPRDTSLRLHSFAFPGWKATVDGRETAVYPSTNLGLVTLDVPAGEHSIRVSFEDTPVRSMTRVASLASLLLLAFVCLARSRWTHARRGYYAALFPLAIMSLPLLVDMSLKGPPSLGANLSWPGQRPLTQVFDNGVRLLGFELHPPSSEMGGDAGIVLYWLLAQPLPGDISASLAWIDSDGAAFPAGAGRPVFGTSPAYTWSSNEVVRDLRPLRLPERRLQAPRLRMTVWHDGKALGEMDLGTFEAVSARPVPTRPETGPSPTNFASQVRLIGFKAAAGGRAKGIPENAARDQLTLADAGDKVRVDLTWLALANLENDYTVFVHLYDLVGKLIAQHDGQPQGGFRPTSLWQQGDFARDAHTVSLPPTAQPGIYRLEVGVYEHRTMDRLTIDGSTGTTKSLGRLKVRPPAAGASPSNALDIAFADAIRLRGYDLSMDKVSAGTPAEGKLSLSLYWSVAGEISDDYKVFVHLLDSAGNIVAQRDGEPLDGNYPTSFWSQGEQLVDLHEIALAAGDLAKVQQVVAGLYGPASGRRLATSTGSDNISIPIASIRP